MGTSGVFVAGTASEEKRTPIRRFTPLKNYRFV